MIREAEELTSRRQEAPGGTGGMKRQTVQMVSGQFAVRGIILIFFLDRECPYRIDMGMFVVSIPFEASTMESQRLDRTVQEIQIYPASDDGAV